MKWKNAIWILVTLLVVGCNGSDGGLDAWVGDCGVGGDGGCGGDDGGAGDDGAAGDDASAGDDADVGEHFTVVIPAGAQE